MPLELCRHALANGDCHDVLSRLVSEAGRSRVGKRRDGRWRGRKEIGHDCDLYLNSEQLQSVKVILFVQ